MKLTYFSASLTVDINNSMIAASRICSDSYIIYILNLYTCVSTAGTTWWKPIYTHWPY